MHCIYGNGNLLSTDWKLFQAVRRMHKQHGIIPQDLPPLSRRRTSVPYEPFFSRVLRPQVSCFLFFRPDTMSETVLKQRWCEIFILGLLQCANQFCLSSMLTAMATHLHTCTLLGQLKMEKYEEVQEQIGCLQAFLRLYEEMNITNLEFGYLKIIAFTATGKSLNCHWDRG